MQTVMCVPWRQQKHCCVHESLNTWRSCNSHVLYSTRLSADILSNKVKVINQSQQQQKIQEEKESYNEQIAHCLSITSSNWQHDGWVLLLQHLYIWLIFQLIWTPGLSSKPSAHLAYLPNHLHIWLIFQIICTPGLSVDREMFEDACA